MWDLEKEYGQVHKGEEGEILQELIVGIKGSGCSCVGRVDSKKIGVKKIIS